MHISHISPLTRPTTRIYDKRYNYTTNAQKRRTAHFKHYISDIYYLSAISSCISDMVSAPD
nr:MAG TPA: hypothetical protein [Caudoviricetes sp.]